MSAPATYSSQELDRSFVRSVAWGAAGDWITQIFAWASFLVVTRLLAPSDFGIVALVASFQPYLAYLAGFGIPRAVVALRDLSEDDLAQLNTVATIFGFIGFGLAALLAKPFAIFFHAPKLVPLAIVSCSALILNGIQSVSGALLGKALRFRFTSVMGAAIALLAAFNTLLFAWLGFHYWALVLGNLSATLVRTVVIVRTRPQSYAWPRWSSLRKPLMFGFHCFITLVALNSYQNLDDLMAGKMLGQTALGFYGLAWTLANVPLEKITSMVTTVIPSYFSVVQHDLPAVRRYVRGITANIALLTFPACVGLGLVAPEFIRVVMGKKWEAAIGPLQVLSIYAAFRSIFALLPKVLTAIGNPRFVMWVEIASLIALGSGFYVGSRWGINGIAWTWVLVYPWVAIPLVKKTFSTIGMTLSEYVGGLRPALDSTIAMVLTVELVRFALSGTTNQILRFVALVLSGALSYTATLLLIHRERAFGLLRFLKKVRS